MSATATEGVMEPMRRVPVQVAGRMRTRFTLVALVVFLTLLVAIIS